MSADTQHILSNNWIKSYDFDPGGTSAVDVGWVDCRGYGHYAFHVFKSVGTGNVSALSILGNTTTTGSGTDVTIKSKTISVQPANVGQGIFIEVSADEVNAAGVAAGVDIVGISASVTLQTGTDECVVTYIFSEPKHAYKNLSADYLS